jgi:hypothetical protein
VRCSTFTPLLEPIADPGEDVRLAVLFGWPAAERAARRISMPSIVTRGRAGLQPWIGRRTELTSKSRVTVALTVAPGSRAEARPLDVEGSPGSVSTSGLTGRRSG